MTAKNGWMLGPDGQEKWNVMDGAARRSGSSAVALGNGATKAATHKDRGLTVERLGGVGIEERSFVAKGAPLDDGQKRVDAWTGRPGEVERHGRCGQEKRIVSGRAGEWRDESRDPQGSRFDG